MPKVMKIFESIVRRGERNSRVRFTDGTTALVDNHKLKALNLTLPKVSIEVREFASKVLTKAGSGRSVYTIQIEIGTCYLRKKKGQNLDGVDETLADLFKELGHKVSEKESAEWMRQNM